MREAVGGTMLMYIVFGFLLIYIFFMAVVINYGRVFRTKNALVSYIEVEEGFKTGIKDSLIAKARNEQGYYDEIYACYVYDATRDITYFTIELEIKFQLPMVSQSVKIPITGETAAIRNVNEPNKEGIHACAEGGSKIPKSGTAKSTYKIADEVG